MQPIYDSNTQAGRAWRACLASILERRLEDVPYFHGSPTWWVDAGRYLEPFGLGLLIVRSEAAPGVVMAFDPYCIASGGAADGRTHSVVYHGERMVHDPEPEGEGLVGGVDEFCFFVKLDPST